MNAHTSAGGASNSNVRETRTVIRSRLGLRGLKMRVDAVGFGERAEARLFAERRAGRAPERHPSGVTRQVVDLARPHFSMSTSSDFSARRGRRDPTCFAVRPIAS